MVGFGEFWIRFSPRTKKRRDKIGTEYQFCDKKNPSSVFTAENHYTTLPERFNHMREKRGERKETWEEPHGKDPSERPLPCKPTVLRFCSTMVLLPFEMIRSLMGTEYLQ